MLEPPPFQTIEANGIIHRVAIEGDGPLVLLIHGFPESWYSWRHQIAPLAAAGYRVAVPDVRGYGGSDKPDAIAAYDMAAMCADAAGIIEALGSEPAVVIGHDWGAPIAWHTALLHPETVRAVAGLSVPYTGRPFAPFTKILKKIYKDRFFYFLYFQTPGVAEAELEADVRGALRKFYYAFSGEGMTNDRPKGKPKDAQLLDGLTDPAVLPSWISEEDLDYYTGEFEQSGFRGPLNRYRNAERDWEMTSDLSDRQIEQPACFIAGALDPVLAFVPGADLIETMKKFVPDLRGCHLIDGAGHWIQQERPDAVNAALLSFLGDVTAPHRP